ncbi:hypothetical protein Tco_0892554 [Tanacetum coccineum]|uniref:Uncharacterized protein n=1 Tax=Tanacetum coccineum TaxID=301880 RepID=A0ABQ5C981_9ASTR
MELKPSVVQRANLRTLFGQDVETFTGTMFLNMDQLEKQLDNEEFQEIGSLANFKVLKTQFQMFIKSHIYLDDEYVVMTRNYFLQYTQLEIQEFCDTLIQHMESMQTTEEKIDTSNALDASLVDTENIRPIYDEEPMDEVQSTAKINVFASGQQHTEQPEFNNEGEVDQNAEQCHDTWNCDKALQERLMSIRPESKTIEHTTSLTAQNAEFKAQLQEKGFAIAALKMS